MRHLVLVFALTALLSPAMSDEPFTSLSISYSGGDYKNETFEYRLLAPLEITAGKKYPLILFLHGAGERGDDNGLQLKYLPEQMADAERRERFDCFILAPQCRSNKKWVDVPWSDDDSTEMSEQATHQMRAALTMLDRTVTENPIDKSRVYLTGLSMGGYGSWDLLSRMPKRFAGAVIICGGGDERQASKLKDIPIWVFHGDADRVVPATRSRTMVEAIQKAGGERIKYSELPGVGHNSWSHAYSDSTGAIEWLLSQKLSE